MGSFISVLLSYENLYEEDDTDNIDNTDKYEFAAISNNEDNVSSNSTTTDWIYFNRTKNYRDVGIELLA